MARAMASYGAESLEACSKPSEFKTMFFALSFLHAVLIGLTLKVFFYYIGSLALVLAAIVEKGWKLYLSPARACPVVSIGQPVPRALSLLFGGIWWKLGQSFFYRGWRRA